MRHVQREGALAIAAAVLLVLAASPAAATDPACQANALPLVVEHQRLFRADGSLGIDAVVANARRAAVRDVYVSVELYDFFGELLRAERAAVIPPIVPPAYRASFRVATPLTQDARTVAYRFTGLRDAGPFQSLVVCHAPSVT